MTIGRPFVPPTERSLLDILEQRAREHPYRQPFIFLAEGESETERFSYGELRRRALSLAGTFQTMMQPGDRALLLYPPGLEFIAALFGCFYAGIIAIPAQPPRFDLTNAGLQRLAGIGRDAQPAAVLTGGEISRSTVDSCNALPELRHCHQIVTDQIGSGAANRYQPQRIDRDTVALLQYTSGSTGDPRAVVINHGNILANSYVIQLAFHHRTTVGPGNGVCWLPFYHDMGLIGNVLQSVYVDARCYVMSPWMLLQRPLRWLQAISRYRAHSSGGPNFAYDLCVERVTEEQKASLDLSSWEIAAIGAEPISHRTMERFSEAFAVCGFRREAFYPCYGLAEATLFVAGGEKDTVPTVRTFRFSDLELQDNNDRRMASGSERLESPQGDGQPTEPSQTLVGCGHAWTEHDIRIVHPVTLQQCAPGTVGEIWFRGPSVAEGYWRRDEQTQATFRAQMNESDRSYWLRTGDLGLLQDSELFIAGRIKDLIVIRGHNHYPQDIEDSVSQIDPAFRPNTGAAFSIPSDQGEQLVILQEIDRTARHLNVDELLQKIRQEIAERHQLQVHDVRFLPRGVLPKTTSGKIRRHECRRLYLVGQLVAWTPRDPDKRKD